MMNMKHAVTIAGGMVLAVAAVLRVTATAGDAEIRRVEQQMHDAYVKHDVSLFASLYADDSTFTYSSGEVSGKAERVKRFTAPYTDLKDDLQQIRISGDTAIVNDRSDYSSSKGEHVALQITRVWLNRSGKWQVAAFQSTPIVKPQ